MDNTNGIQPVMPLGGNNDLGANSFAWIFGLLILMGMMNGNGWSGGNNNSNAIQSDVNRGFDNQNLQAQTRDILTAVNNGTMQTTNNSTQNAQNAINAIKDGNASMIREFGAVETALTALSGQTCQLGGELKALIEKTSAQTDANIAQAKYENAMNLAAFEQRLTAKIDANKIDELQQQVNQLQLQQATAGMLKFPNSWSYGAGPFPPIWNGCQCNNV